MAPGMRVSPANGIVQSPATGELPQEPSMSTLWTPRRALSRTRSRGACQRSDSRSSFIYAADRVRAAVGDLNPPWCFLRLQVWCRLECARHPCLSGRNADRSSAAGVEKKRRPVIIMTRAPRPVGRNAFRPRRIVCAVLTALGERPVNHRTGISRTGKTADRRRQFRSSADGQHTPRANLGLRLPTGEKAGMVPGVR